jgi:DNA replication and repair protein RecF
MIAPDDVQIITNGSEERRRFMDALFSQIDHQYLLQLMLYNRLLLQRNSLLKQMAESGQRSTELLDVLDEQMTAPANYVSAKRQAFLGEILEMVRSRYSNIAGENYNLELRYESSLLHTPFADLIGMNRGRDLQSQRTLLGIHRDDIVISLNEQPFRQIASQGQRKSLLFAFKLAEFAKLKETKGYAPILLLDDVFEKLDPVRMQNLLYEVCVENKGQVLVTDTHPERIKESFTALGLPYGSINTVR